MQTVSAFRRSPPAGRVRWRLVGSRGLVGSRSAQRSSPRVSVLDPRTSGPFNSRAGVMILAIDCPVKLATQGPITAIVNATTFGENVLAGFHGPSNRPVPRVQAYR